MAGKLEVGSEVTVSRLRGVHKIEAVKEQYYIRDEGWFDACALTPYVLPLQVGDPIRHKLGGARGTIRHIEAGLACWVNLNGDALCVSPLCNIERDPTREAVKS